ncbi:MAG TPA: AAA family ATPase [Streptosporangiaceae bacterium]|nr:AAA family ATPase [Streptosporangiaceae bacterium]
MQSVAGARTPDGARQPTRHPYGRAPGSPYSPSVTTAALHGREDELSALSRLLARAGEGSGGSLLVVGDAGLGKSALLAAATGEATALNYRVLSAAGVRREARLPFAGLHQLLQPLRRNMSRLPAPLRAALESVFGRSGVAHTEPFLIALATLELLANAAATRPVVVVTDDLQWLDGASRDVLSFVSRRVAVEPIALVFAAREENPLDAPMDDLPRVRLAPLSSTAAGSLLEAKWPGLRNGLRGLVLAAAAGNPLALEELPAIGERDPLLLAASHAGQMPLTERLERSFTARLPELGAACRTALLAVASSDGEDLGEALAAATIVAGRQIDVADLDSAVSAGLVSYGGGNVAFRHPLVRSGICGSFTAGEKEEMHAALASTLVDSPQRSVWHRAASVSGPDEGLAAEFDAAADHAQEVGALDVAVEALQRAASLGNAADRDDRLIRAAEISCEMGRPPVVDALLQQVDGSTLDALQLGRFTWVTEITHPSLHGDPLRIDSVLRTARDAREAGDAELGLTLLWLAASRCFWDHTLESRGPSVIEAAREFGPLSSHPMLIGIFAYAAPTEFSAEVVAALIARSSATNDAATNRVLGSAAIAVGAFDLAGPFLSRAASVLRDRGRLGHLSRVLVLQAWAAIHTDDWTVALPLAEEAERLATERGDLRWRTGSLSDLLLIAAIRGDSATVASLAAEAGRVAIPSGWSSVASMCQVARGIIALGAGEYEDAYQQLRRTFDPADPAFHASMSLWGLGDCAEAALHAGHSAEGKAILAQVRSTTQSSAGRMVVVAGAYAEALLADDADADALYSNALALSGSWSWMRGRISLAYGMWLRRQRRVVEARVPLRVARDCFDMVGAREWARRAREELRASGATSEVRSVQMRGQLTSQELQIAQLAAQGLTNREIAQRLYVSHRTVGAQLSKVFQKLGLKSRAALRDALGPDVLI